MAILSKEYQPTFWWYKKIHPVNPDGSDDGSTWKQKIKQAWEEFKGNLSKLVEKIKECITNFSGLSYSQEFLCLVIGITLVAILIVGAIFLYFASGIISDILALLGDVFGLVQSLGLLFANFFSFVESGLSSITGTIRQGILTFFDIADWCASSTNTSVQLWELIAATITVIAAIDLVRQFAVAAGEFNQTAIGRVFKILDWPFKTFLDWLKEDLPTALWLIAWVLFLPLRGVAMVLSVLAGLIWDTGEAIWHAISNFGHDEKFK